MKHPQNIGIDALGMFVCSARADTFLKKLLFEQFL